MYTVMLASLGSGAEAGEMARDGGHRARFLMSLMHLFGLTRRNDGVEEHREVFLAFKVV